MSNFGELKEAIRRALVRDTELSADGSAALTPDTIDYYTQRAIEFYRNEALYFNQAISTATTLVVSQDFIAPPTDFIQPLHWRITTSGLGS